MIRVFKRRSFLAGIALGAFLMFYAAGCLSFRMQTIAVNGAERKYLLHVPPNLAQGTPAPLVLALHQFSDTPEGMESLSDFNELADKEGFIVAYPKGNIRVWNAGQRGEPDDIAFLEALVQELARKHPVDLKRVYACGISAGGMMAQWFACKSDTFAAIAEVAGSLSRSTLEPITQQRNIPALLMHGTDDPVVPYNGGETYAGPGMRPTFFSAEEQAAFWAARNGCGETPVMEELPPIDPKDPTRVKRFVYPCAEGREVVRYQIDGGGHTWPGHDNWYPAFIVGPTSHQIDATLEIWRFFQRHARP